MVSLGKGGIAFALDTVSTRLYAASEDHDVSFHRVYQLDGGRIRYRRGCKLDGTEVPSSEIGTDALPHPAGTSC